MVRPRGLIFAIYCFLILYTVNLCLSFSINREKEREKICERIDTITDPVKREEKLIQIAIDEKVEAEEKLAELSVKLGAELGQLRNEISLISVPMEVFQMRDAFEKRIDWIYGATGKPAGKGYVAALEEAVTSNEKYITSNLRIMEFRSVIIETGFDDMESFIDIVKVLYRDFSFGQAHKIAGSRTKLPSYEDEVRISKILEAAGVRLDPPNIKAVQAFLKPCKEMGKKAPGDDQRCLIFKSGSKRHEKLFKPEAKISKEDIFLAFPEIEPLQAAWVIHVDKNQKKVYTIQVEFDTEKNAERGFHDNHGWIKKLKVKPEQSPCYNKASTDVIFEEIFSRPDDNDSGEMVAQPNSSFNSKKSVVETSESSSQ